MERAGKHIHRGTCEQAAGETALPEVGSSGQGSASTQGAERMGGGREV